MRKGSTNRTRGKSSCSKEDLLCEAKVCYKGNLFALKDSIKKLLETSESSYIVSDKHLLNDLEIVEKLIKEIYKENKKSKRKKIS